MVHYSLFITNENHFGTKYFLYDVSKPHISLIMFNNVATDYNQSMAHKDHHAHSEHLNKLQGHVLRTTLRLIEIKSKQGEKGIINLRLFPTFNFPKDSEK